MARDKAILVLNAGSSSLKYALYEIGKQARRTMQGLVEQIGTPRTKISHQTLEGAIPAGAKADGTLKSALDAPDHKAAMEKVVEIMQLKGRPLAGVGHRVVHGGESLTSAALITEEVKELIKKSSALAPLHNTPNLMGIAVAQELFNCPQVAVLDTAFHSTLPPESFMYAIPYSLYQDLGIRRYGFHGTSYMYLTRETARLLDRPVSDTNLIILHIGAGASICAVKNGRSIDTSMGVTPLEGLVMASRSGDIDPAIVKILYDQQGLTPDKVDSLLNKQSGLLGLAGTVDMRQVLERAEAGDEKAQIALKVWVYRVRKYIGAYLMALGGRLDALVFSAGIGERSVPIRKLVCEDLGAFGMELDLEKNASFGEGDGKPHEVQTQSSRVKIMVVPTDEELMIAQETCRVIEEQVVMRHEE